MMPGCLDPKTIAALCSRSLTEPERQHTLRHLSLCPNCRTRAEEHGYAAPLRPELAPTAAAPPARLTQPDTAAGSGDENPVLRPGAGGAAEARLGLADTAAAPERGARVSVHEDAAPFVGRVIAGYRIKREIGHGGMGAVYEAVHERLGQRAAVKVMFPQFSRDPGFIQRFRSEARAASVVNHPGLVTIFNHGQFPDGIAYILMEYLEGESLRSRIAAGRMNTADALRMVRQISSALCAVHQHGIVHRDLKPDNVMIIPDADLPGGERVKIVDFGIAKTETNPTGATTGQRTFMGTVHYASPEQCRMSSTLDGKSDVYSLGVILYEMLGGEVPFSGSMTEVLGLHVSAAPRPLRSLSAAVPPEVSALVHDMLAKAPPQRPTMAQVRDLIDQLTAERAGDHTRRSLAIGASVIALLGTLAALLHLLGRI